MSCCSSESVTNSSVHTGNQRRRIEQMSVTSVGNEGVDSCFCKSPGSNRLQTPIESQRLVSRITNCDLIYDNNRQHSVNCLTSQEVANGSRSLTNGSTVTDIVHTRSHHRVRSIDELSRSNRRASASERTSRLRDNLTNNRYLQVRHAEHFRTQIPLPPCPGPRQTNPGRQRVGCNEGFSNVGLSDPLA